MCLFFLKFPILLGVFIIKLSKTKISWVVWVRIVDQILQFLHYIRDTKLRVLIIVSVKTILIHHPIHVEIHHAQRDTLLQKIHSQHRRGFRIVVRKDNTAFEAAPTEIVGYFSAIDCETVYLLKCRGISSIRVYLSVWFDEDIREESSRIFLGIVELFDFGCDCLDCLGVLNWYEATFSNVLGSLYST